jgi:hypothetical protein
VFCGTAQTLFAREELPMKKFFVLYGDYDEYFVCDADDAKHAVEQCEDYLTTFNGYYPESGQVNGVFRGEQDDSWINFPVE